MQVEQVSVSPKTLSRYRKLGRDFAWLFAGAILLAFLIFLGEYVDLPPVAAIPLGILRLLLGLFYILYVPGYCLTAAFFPARDDLDGVERLALSLGLSVAWVSILAFTLDKLPWGLQLWSIFIAELLSILLFMIIALWRRSRLDPAVVYFPAARWQPLPWWASLGSQNRVLLIVAAAAFTLAAFTLAWFFLVPSDDELITEYYILGRGGLAEDYPREGQVGQELSVTMGITNRERETRTYDVEIWVVDPEADRRELVSTAGPFFLDPGQTIERPLTWAMPWLGDDQIVDFYLYTARQEDRAEPYRSLRLWLNVVQPPAEPQTPAPALIEPTPQPRLEDASPPQGGFQVVPSPGE